MLCVLCVAHTRECSVKPGRGPAWWALCEGRAPPQLIAPGRAHEPPRACGRAGRVTRAWRGKEARASSAGGQRRRRAGATEQVVRGVESLLPRSTPPPPPPFPSRSRRGEDVATDKGVAHWRGLGVAHWRGGYSENATSTGTGTGRRCRRVLHSRGLLVGQAARACPGVAPRQAHRQRRPHLCASCPVSGPGCAGAARREQPPVPQRRVSGRVAGAAARCARRLCTPPRRSPVEYSLHATRPAYMPAAGLPVVVGDTCQHASLCACACSFADMW